MATEQDKDSKDKDSPQEPIDYKAKFEALDIEHKKILDQVESFTKFTALLMNEFHDIGMKALNCEDMIRNLFKRQLEPN